jgi:hypothetical protein
VPTILLLVLTARAVPPSSSLTGDTGTLTWTVTRDGETVVIDGRSPKWTVRHVATPDLHPVHTERTDAQGRRAVVDYTPTGAEIHTDGKTVQVSGSELWDGDTVDVRLGELAAAGHADRSFRAVDPASGKVYGFEAKTVGPETCGTSACSHVHLAMTGMYRVVGPSWDYWFDGAGRLVRFTGPIGTFVAAK